MNVHDLFDVEVFERMIALACATFTVGEKADYQRTLAIAASYLEFIDPLADPDFERQPVTIKFNK